MKKMILWKILLLLSHYTQAQHYSKQQIDHLIDSINQVAKHNPDQVLPASFTYYKYSHDIGYKKGMASSLLLTGQGMLLLGQYDAALQYAGKSGAIAGKKHYSELLCEAYQLEARCCKLLGVEYRVRELLEKAMKVTVNISDQNKRAYKQGRILSGLANYYQWIEKKDSALIYYENSDNAFSQMKTDEVKNRARSLVASDMATICFENKQYDLAKVYAKKAEKLARFTDCVEVKMKIFQNKAGFEMINGNNKTAINDYEMVLLLAKQLREEGVMEKVYQKLSVLYDKVGEEEMAVQCFSESHRISSYLEQSKRKAQELPVKIVIKKNEEQLKQSCMGILCTLFFTIAFILFLLGRMIWYHRKTKQGKLKVSQDELQLQRKEELLKKAKDVETVTVESIIRLAKNKDPQFLVQFAIIHFEFYEWLQELKPPLKKEELEICAMRKLGFSVKEIAIVTEASVRSVEARIYRIRKKIKEASGKDVKQEFKEL